MEAADGDEEGGNNGAMANIDDLFTPAGRPPSHTLSRDFSGFRAENEGGARDMMLRRRVFELERQMKEMCGKMEKAEKQIHVLTAENIVLRKEVDGLRGKTVVQEHKIHENVAKVKEMDEKQNAWRVEQEKERIDFKNIMENQIKEENLTKAVVKVIKEKDHLVRETVDKRRCVVVFGLAEGTMPNRRVREEEERKVAVKVLGACQQDTQESQHMEGEIEEVVRLGKFEEGKQRPMKIKLRSQSAAEQTLAGTWRLSGREEYRKVFVRQDLNEEERKLLSELWREAKEKNLNRTETEKTKYYWRVVDMKLRKWYRREEEEEKN